MAENPAPAQGAQPQFLIEKIYVKDVSVEIPNAPDVFLERESPQVEFQFRNEGKPIREDHHEVVLTATVTAKLQNKTFFLVEASQAGIFLIQNVPTADVEMIYGITCPTILLPYLRETVSDLTVRAGFPPVILAPVNFEAVYRAQQQNRQPNSEQKH